MDTDSLELGLTRNGSHDGSIARARPAAVA